MTILVFEPLLLQGLLLQHRRFGEHHHHMARGGALFLRKLTTLEMVVLFLKFTSHSIRLIWAGQKTRVEGQRHLLLLWTPKGKQTTTL